MYDTGRFGKVVYQMGAIEFLGREDQVKIRGFIG
jgi:non-ribosomal peptide synthetase component F